MSTCSSKHNDIITKTSVLCYILFYLLPLNDDDHLSRSLCTILLVLIGCLNKEKTHG